MKRMLESLMLIECPWFNVQQVSLKRLLRKRMKLETQQLTQKLQIELLISALLLLGGALLDVRSRLSKCQSLMKTIQMKKKRARVTQWSYKIWTLMRIVCRFLKAMWRLSAIMSNLSIILAGCASSILSLARRASLLNWKASFGKSLYR